ncbi:MAG: hypothetical protein Q7K42_04830 [Candidatus Diapherotrites archaeon]|nr:hypothetical protein [Candidatus Diapherotrites archaeon]
MQARRFRNVPRDKVDRPILKFSTSTSISRFNYTVRHAKKSFGKDYDFVVGSLRDNAEKTIEDIWKMFKTQGKLVGLSLAKFTELARVVKKKEGIESKVKPKTNLDRIGFTLQDFYLTPGISRIIRQLRGRKPPVSIENIIAEINKQLPKLRKKIAVNGRPIPEDFRLSSRDNRGHLSKALQKILELK